MESGEPQIDYNETNNKIYNMEAETLEQKKYLWNVWF